MQDGAPRVGRTITFADTRRVLYRLPELKAAARTSPLGGGWLCLVEGEKDVNRLWALGIPATQPGGTGSGTTTTSQLFRAPVSGVVLLPDNDAPGRKHMREILRRGLAFKGLDFKWLEAAGLPDKGDVSDWLTGGQA